MIKHIFKEGTDTEDAHVPKKMVERIHGIVKEGTEDEEEIQNQKRKPG